jgi:hypothetical protein
MFKKKMDIDRHGPRPMPNSCKNLNPPNFSLPSTFKFDMVWQYRSPIPVGGGGGGNFLVQMIFIFRPSRVVEGGGMSAPCGMDSVVILGDRNRKRSNPQRYRLSHLHLQLFRRWRSPPWRNYWRRRRGRCRGYCGGGRRSAGLPRRANL